MDNNIRIQVQPILSRQLVPSTQVLDYSESNAKGNGSTFMSPHPLVDLAI